MKPSPFLALAAACAALTTFTGCETTPPKQAGAIVVTLTSETPVAYGGTIRVDGQNQTVSGTTPAVLQYWGTQADCDIKKVSGTGTLKIDVKVGGRTVTVKDTGSHH